MLSIEYCWFGISTISILSVWNRFHVIPIALFRDTHAFIDLIAMRFACTNQYATSVEQRLKLMLEIPQFMADCSGHVLPNSTF